MILKPGYHIETSKPDPNITLDIDLETLDMFKTAKLVELVHQAVNNLGSDTTPYYIFLGSAETLGNYGRDQNNIKEGGKELNPLVYNYMKSPALNETELNNFKEHPYRLYLQIQRKVLNKIKPETALNETELNNFKKHSYKPYMEILKNGINTANTIDGKSGKQDIRISFELLKDSNKHNYSTIGFEKSSLHSEKMNLAEFLDWYAQHQQYLSIPEEIANKTNKGSTSSTPSLKEKTLTKFFGILGKTSKGDRKNKLQKMR